MLLLAHLVIIGATLAAVRVNGQQSLEDRIQTIFGNSVATRNGSAAASSLNTRLGFDVIVQPEPIVEVRLRIIL